MKRKNSSKRSDDARMRRSGAAASGYHSPTRGDIRDIRHNHNTAAPGSLTADEAIRRSSGTDDSGPDLP